MSDLSARALEVGQAAPPPERLLLVQPRWMGDVLLCTPALRAARRAFPRARIDFLTEAPGADALRGNPHLSGLLVIQPGLPERLRLLREIRRRRYDAVVDFRSTSTTAQVAVASGARLRVGVRGRGPRNLAYTHLLPRDPGREYMARQKLRLLAPLGVDADAAAGLALEVAVGSAERRRAAEVWRAAGLAPDRPVVALSPTSREEYKQWGAERWARVADAVAAAGAQVLVTGAPGQRDQVLATVRAMRSPAVWEHGAATIAELAALYERCALWIGNDGGAKHVAAAAGVPTLSVQRRGLGTVWTDPSPGSPHRYLEGPEADAGPRGGLDSLAPEVVSAAARESLAALSPRAHSHRGALHLT